PPVGRPPASPLVPYTTLFRSRVLLVLDDTTAFPIAFLGAMRIGAVPVPVSQLDKDENFRHYVEDSYATVVVTDVGSLDRLRGALDRKSTRLNSSHEWISYAVF